MPALPPASGALAADRLPRLVANATAGPSGGAGDAAPSLSVVSEAVIVDVAPPVGIAGGAAAAERTSHGAASTSPTAVVQAVVPSAVGPSLQPHQLPVAATVAPAPGSVQPTTPAPPLPTMRERVSVARVTALETTMPPPALPVTVSPSSVTPSSDPGTVL